VVAVDSVPVVPPDVPPDPFPAFEGPSRTIEPSMMLDVPALPAGQAPGLLRISNPEFIPNDASVLSSVNDDELPSLLLGAWELKPFLL
jgi:hypothetical protein